MSIKWTIFEDQVFLLNNFDHPGGNAILELILYRDITAIIHGHQLLVAFDVSGYVFLEHCHSLNFEQVIQNKSFY